MIEKRYVPEIFGYFNFAISIVIYIFNTNFNTFTEDEEHLNIGLEMFLEWRVIIH